MHGNHGADGRWCNLDRRGLRACSEEVSLVVRDGQDSPIFFRTNGDNEWPKLRLARKPVKKD
jgi:hypothetical protein